jgi:hypothetical protein
MAISEIQVASGSGLIGSSPSVTFTNPCGSHSVNIVYFSYLSGGTTTLSSISTNTGSMGGIIHTFDSGGSTCVEGIAWQIGQSGVTFTITLNFSAPITVCNIAAVEYSTSVGGAAITPVSSLLTAPPSAIGAGTGVAINTGTQTSGSFANAANPSLNGSPNLIVAGASFTPSGGMISDPSPSWTKRYEIVSSGTSSIGSSFGDIVAATGATAIPSWTYNNGSPYFWATMSLAFYEATISNNPLPSITLARQIDHQTQYAE